MRLSRVALPACLTSVTLAYAQPFRGVDCAALPGLVTTESVKQYAVSSLDGILSLTFWKEPTLSISRIATGAGEPGRNRIC